MALELKPGNFLAAARKLLVAGQQTKGQIYGMKLHLIRMLRTEKPNSGTRSSGAQICARLKNGTISDDGGDKMNKTSFVYGVVVGIAVFCLGTISAQGQNFYCVRAGATGSGNGLDWTNAYTSLPATLQRGAIYYVAGGSYPSWTFNTPHSGTNVCTVKKATPTAHGTEAGWVASYGTSQAVFDTQISVYRGYFVLDGQYRNESNWFDGNAYGFKIQSINNWESLVILDPNAQIQLSDITIKYLFIASPVGILPSTGRTCTINTDTYSSTIRNLNGVFSHIFIDGGNNPFLLRGFSNPLMEYCASWRTCGSEAAHGEVVNLFYTYASGSVIRYNYFKDCFNGVSGYPAGGGTGVIAIAEDEGVEIYGNIVENAYCGDGVVAAGWANDNIKIYNNTIINKTGGANIFRFPQNNNGSGNVAYNNLIVNSSYSSISSGAGTEAYNSDLQSTIFVNFAGGDFHLSGPTAAGITLSSPYNVDFDGNVRGADGNWDRGAYEYNSNTSTNSVITASPSSFKNFGSILTNTTTPLILTVSNTSTGTVVGKVTLAVINGNFQITSGSNYFLGAKQYQKVIVVVNPSTPGFFTNTIILNGGGTILVPVSGTAVNTSSPLTIQTLMATNLPGL